MKHNKYLTLLIATIMAVLTMTSCGDEDQYYYSPIEGTWELVSINGMPVDEPQVCEFIFYGDGSGLYGQYNPFPHWSTNSISWDMSYTDGGADYLHVYTWDGQRWDYLVRLYQWELVLTDTYTGDVLRFRD